MRMLTWAMMALLAGCGPPRPEITLDSRDIDGRVTQVGAEFAVPAGPGPFPAVVLLHGCAGVDHTRESGWAGWLVQNGFAVMAVDSFTLRGISQTCGGVDHERGNWRGRRDHARAALAWLRADPRIDGRRVALMGQSEGGAVTLMSQERPFFVLDFAAFVAVYPYCSGPPMAVPYERPTLIAIGDADDWTPPESCKVLQAQAAFEGRPVELLLYPGAHHGFDMRTFQRSALHRVYLIDSFGQPKVVHGGYQREADLAARQDVVAFLRRAMRGS
jgi:dienelactone hydrolase